MTNSEFSDAFDTLLNSYASQAQFGDEASKQEIVLDEYEKSVMLTQAQDIILKSFFDRKQNSAGDGFDDSTRRQVDFSSLIKAATLSQATDQSSAFDDRGIIYKMPLRKYPDASAASGWSEKEGTTDVLFILNEQLKTFVGTTTTVPAHWSNPYYPDTVYEGAYTNAMAATLPVTDQYPAEAYGFVTTAIEEAEGDGWSWTDEVITKNGINKNYVIVPINYREYDREMTKAYAQPLKKQVWRLFQNSVQGFDIQSELIPRWNLAANETIEAYKIRYIRRPCPIVLVDLPNELEIDGYTKAQECELNPILHPEILQKALELAINTRGRIPSNSRGNQENNRQ